MKTNTIFKISELRAAILGFFLARIPGPNNASGVFIECGLSTITTKVRTFVFAIFLFYSPCKNQFQEADLKENRN